MDKNCRTCRHWFEFNDTSGPPVGTCRARAPVRGGCLGDLDLTDPVDRLSAMMWPVTASVHLCGRHDWRCQSSVDPDCRAPIQGLTLGDEMDGTLYCMQHHDEKRRRPVLVGGSTIRR